MSVLEKDRTETPFTTRDNMLEIWNRMTELSFRGFGLKKRKPPKTPGNFDTWSEKSRQSYLVKMEDKRKQQEQWDLMFIQNESRIVDDLCRQIVYLIDASNTISPQYLCECDDQRLKQDEAIGLCNNLKRELNHIAETIPCNKNFLAKITEDIAHEIELLKGWRKSCNAKRKSVIEKEISMRTTVAEKMGFIINGS